MADKSNFMKWLTTGGYCLSEGSATNYKRIWGVSILLDDYLRGRGIVSVNYTLASKLSEVLKALCTSETCGQWGPIELSAYLANFLAGCVGSDPAIPAGTKVNVVTVSEAFSKILDGQFTLFNSVINMDFVPATNSVAPKKEEKKMTDPVKKYTLAGNFNEAAWLAFSNRIIAAAQRAAVAAFMRNLGETDEGIRTKIAAVMQTDLGKAICGMTLATLADQFGTRAATRLGLDKAKLEFIASRLQVASMTLAIDNVAEAFLEPVLQEIENVIKGVPDFPEPVLVEGHKETVTVTKEKEKVEERANGAT